MTPEQPDAPETSHTARLGRKPRGLLDNLGTAGVIFAAGMGIGREGEAQAPNLKAPAAAKVPVPAKLLPLRQDVYHADQKVFDMPCGGALTPRNKQAESEWDYHVRYQAFFEKQREFLAKLDLALDDTEGKVKVPIAKVQMGDNPNTKEKEKATYLLPAGAPWKNGLILPQIILNGGESRFEILPDSKMDDTFLHLQIKIRKPLSAITLVGAQGCKVKVSANDPELSNVVTAWRFINDDNQYSYPADPKDPHGRSNIKNGVIVEIQVPRTLLEHGVNQLTPDQPQMQR